MATRNWACSADAVGATNGSSEYGGDCDHLPVGYMSWLGGASRAFLKFTLDWSGVVQITKAELKIRTTTGYHGSIGASNTCYVDLVTTTWAEGTSGETWVLNQQPDYSESVNTGYRASFTARSTSTWYTVDITSIVNRWAPSSVKQSNGSAGPGATNYGIRIISNSEGASANRTEFHAREAGTSDAYIVLTYTTNQAPTVVSLDSPANGATITDDTPALVATLDDPDAADTVAQYAVQVDNNSDFSSPAVNLADQAIGSPANTVQVTHTVASALPRGVTYYWRFQAEDNQGLKGAWSAARQFYLATQPTLDQFSPTADAFATIHNLGDNALWTDGSFAKPRLQFRYTSTSALASASYRVRVYDASSGGSTVADTGTVAWVAASGTVKSVDLATAMPRNTSRWWTVEVLDSAGGTSGESARQQFRVQWGQALYEANPGASSSGWDFDLGAVAGGSVVARFRTATQSGAAGSFGTVSSWVANIADLDPAAWVNVLVRMTPTTAGVNVTLGSMTLTYLGSSVSPDNWARVPSAEWTLSTGQRRFGAKSLKCSVVAGTTGNRYVYPYRLTSGDDIPVIPGVTYTWSVYVNTPVPLTGGSLRVKVFQGGSLSVEVPTDYVTKATQVVTSTVAEVDGWSRLAMTFTAPPGWTSIRPMIHYLRASGVTEVFYVDGAKLEEGPVATPWQAGAIGAVILDSGGIVVDRQAGGTLRLRAVDGTTFELGTTGLDVNTGATRGLTGLGSGGVVFGSDTALDSPQEHLLGAGASGSFAAQGVSTGGGASGTANYWGKVGTGTITNQYGEVALVGTILGVGDSGDDHGAALVSIRVKQQAAFGSQPTVYARVDGRWDADDVAVFVTSVAGPTTFEVWARTQASFQAIRFAVLHLGLNSGSYVPNAGVALQSGTPSGTAYYADAQGHRTPVVNTYTTTGANTWTKPLTGLDHIVVEVIGGGGGGGGVAATVAYNAVAAGGGGGGYARRVYAASELPGTCTATVGVGGTAGAAGANTGGTGGTSSFAGTGITTVQATGGAGGQGMAGSTSNVNSSVGAAGTGSGGHVNGRGQEGAGGRIVDGGITQYGCSGGSVLAGGIEPGKTSAGATGMTPGGGGSGASSATDTAARAGGAGGPGMVIVTEFYG